jgi:hypothetical protein
LRDLTGQNHVSERTLLSQFYRNLDKTTRMLVKQDPVPTTLEQAVNKATAIDDPIDNVAQGMMNIGQAWVTAPNAFSVTMSGTMGSVAIDPGVGVGSGPTSESLMAQMGTESQEVAFFTTPGHLQVHRDVGRAGRAILERTLLQTTKKHQQSKMRQEGRASGKRGVASGDKRAKVRMVQAKDDESSEDSEEEPAAPQRKKQKAARKSAGAVRVVKAEPKSVGTEQKPPRSPNADTRCFACGGTGHFARECTDPEARARNDAYLASRAAMVALRYVRPSVADDEQPRQGDEPRRATEEGGSLPTSGEKRKTEEGGDPGVAGGMPGCEEGGTPAMNSETSALIGTKSVSEGGELVSASSGTDPISKDDGEANDVRSIARVSRAEKQKKRVAKRLRVANTKDVDSVVTALDYERRTRREHQRSEAREVFAQRGEQREAVRLLDDGRVAQVRLVQQQTAAHGATARDDSVYSVLAEDGLPTAAMDVEGERLPVKLDSGARYSVAGTDWMRRGERARRPAPVDVVEGIGGFTLDVLGVWTFNMRNAFGQAVTVEACIIDDCTDEFLVGVDFLQHHKATMNFEKNEVRYDEKEQQVVIPFRTDTGDGGAKVAAVRLVSWTKLTRSAVTPVEVAVAAPDGEQGVFVPTMTCGSVMLAATVTTSQNGKSLVPMINVQGSKDKLPSKKELGVWILLEEGMQVLALSGELDRDNLDAWLNELGDTETPLDNADDVRVGEAEPDARAMVMRLLRAYREVSKDKDDCPPVTALNVEYHIDRQCGAHHAEASSASSDGGRSGRQQRGQDAGGWRD